MTHVEPVSNARVRTFPDCTKAESARLETAPLAMIEPVIKSIFAGSVSIIFSRNAGLEPVFVRVIV